MNFVHISDTHFRHQPMQEDALFPLEKIVDWEGKRLRKLLSIVKNQSQRPDFVVLTGDLVHESNAEDYRLLRELLDDELQVIPYYVALGNHDSRAAFQKGFLGKDEIDIPYYAVSERNGLRIISLDTCLEDRFLSGQIGETQLDFLKAELSALSPKGTLILMHHPMALTYALGFGMPGKHALTLSKDTDTLAALFVQSDVRAVLSGHTHFPSLHTNHNILYATAAGSAFGIDPTNQSKMMFQDTASYFVGRIEEHAIFMAPVNVPFSGETLFEFDFPAYVPMEETA